MTPMNPSMKQKQNQNIENRLVVAKGEGGKDWEFEISSCKLVHTVVVLNLSGTREWFYERQFFHGLMGTGGGGGVR